MYYSKCTTVVPWTWPLSVDWQMSSRSRLTAGHSHYSLSRQQASHRCCCCCCSWHYMHCCCSSRQDSSNAVNRIIDHHQYNHHHYHYHNHITMSEKLHTQSVVSYTAKYATMHVKVKGRFDASRHVTRALFAVKHSDLRALFLLLCYFCSLHYDVLAILTTQYSGDWHVGLSALVYIKR